LDEVVARALAKDPAARYPSAGDLGRAAVAAAADRNAPSNEHSVAVGEAALRTTAAAQPRQRPLEADPEPEPRGARTVRMPEHITAALEARPSEAPQIHRAKRDRRGLRIALALALALAVAAGAAALAFAPQGGGDQRTVDQRTPPSNTAPTSKSGSGGTANGRLPAQSRAVMAARITDLLRRFYGTQINGDWQALRDLTTARYQRHVIDNVRGGYPQWVRNQANGAKYFAGANAIEVEILGTDPADGSVTVYARGLRIVGDPNANCRTWQGVTWARWEGGRWLYDPYTKATQARAAEADRFIGTGCYF
jgi:hypothetical protein